MSCCCHACHCVSEETAIKFRSPGLAGRVWVIKRIKGRDYVEWEDVIDFLVELKENDDCRT